MGGVRNSDQTGFKVCIFENPPFFNYYICYSNRYVLHQHHDDVGDRVSLLFSVNENYKRNTLIDCSL